jgi:hypothetical protein
MKRILSVLFVFAFAFSLSACGKNPPSLADRVGQENPSGQNLESYTGVIEPIQISLYEEGTHEIKTDSGETVVIQSPTINLTNYVGKKVTVKGAMRKLAHNTQEVFTVDEIQMAEGESVTVNDYESRKWGFSFQSPSNWELGEDGDGINLKNNGAETVKVIVSNLDTPLDDFVAAHEVEDGALVTVAGQRSYRYTDASKIRLYVPNASKKRVYRIEFAGSESDQAAFYSLLESFKILEGKAAEGDKCGGKEDLSCVEGFRCELSGAEEEAEGVCMPVEDAKTGSDCPFVPKPAGCVNIEPKSMNLNGCPTSYVCADKPTDGSAKPVTEPAKPTTSVDAVLAAFHTAQSGLLPAGSEVQQFEIVSEQDLLAVVYKQEDKKFKVLYGTGSEGGGIEFNRLASYQEGDKRDWVLSDGKEVKITFDKKIIKPGADLSTPQIVSKDLRLYENVIKDFSIQYPKDWYYRSFGAVEGKIWAVGFSDKPFERYDDIVVYLVVDKGESAGKSEVKGDRYRIEKARDATSHFVLNGPLAMKDQLEAMAETLKQN